MTLPTSSKSILHLVVGYTVGGIENQLLNLLPRLQARGYVGTVCSLKGKDVLAEEYRKRGVRTLSLNGRGKWDATILWRLYSLLRDENADILHCYTSRANWAGTLMGRMAGVPVIVLSDREIRSWLRPWHRWVDQICFRVARGMIVPAQAIKDFDGATLGHEKERIWVIPNGVDVDAFGVPEPKEAIREELGLDPRNPLIGYVGRLDESVKGIGYLLEALSLLQTEGQAPHLVVVGEGPSERGLRQKVRLLALEDLVDFQGIRRDIPRVMKALDLLVQPSLLEGCPNVVLEAMAAGTPIVATRVGGTPELIQHGETGWLVSPGDPMGLAQGIEFMLTNTELADAMAQKAKEWVRAHRSIGVTVSALIGLYDALMDSKEPPRIP